MATLSTQTPLAGGNLISPTADPTFAALLQAAQAAIPQNQPSVMDIAAQGASSPLLSAILGPMLQRLQQPQAAQRQALTEATRASGGLRDSAYTTGLNTLMNQQGLQQNDLMAQILQQTLAPLLNATMQQQQMAYNPSKILSDLLGQTRPQFIPPQNVGGFGGGGGGGASISDPFGVLSQGSAASANAAAQKRFDTMYSDGGGGGNMGGGWNPPATPTPQSDPLTQYLLGAMGGSNPITQTGANTWASTPTTPDTYGLANTSDWSFYGDHAPQQQQADYSNYY